LTVLVLLSLSTGVSAISPFAPKGRGDVGLKAGIIGRTDVDIDGEIVSSGIGFSIGPFFDIPLSQRFSLGVAVDFSNIEVLDQQQFFLDVAVPFKFTKKWKRRGLALKPAVAIGFGHLADIGFLERSSYLTTKAYVELHWLLPKRQAWVAELGVFWAPVGGNREHDVKLGPVAMARLGFVL
jgi:hypothetical protein